MKRGSHSAEPLKDCRTDSSGQLVKRKVSRTAKQTSERCISEPANSATHPATSCSTSAMHLAGGMLAANGPRIVTRSKARQLEESSHLLPLSAGAAAADHGPSLIATQPQPGSTHPATALPSATKRLQAASAAGAAARQHHQLQQLPSDDLQHLLDAAGPAAAAGSRLMHPSLLRNGGMAKQSHPQQLPILAASHGLMRGAEAAAAAVTGAALPALRLHNATGASISRSHHHAGSSSDNSSSKHTASSRPGRAAAAVDATVTSKHSGAARAGKRVSFAPGPLSAGTARTMVSADGHPASEGALAVPVRRLPQSYALDLTRGNVLMLEQLLGSECGMSVTRLKRRVGLLPPIRAPRPHVSMPAGRADPFNGQEEAAASPAPAALAAAAAAEHAEEEEEQRVTERLVAASAVPVRVPGKARSVGASAGIDGRKVR